jgi:hypothetical protein
MNMSPSPSGSKKKPCRAMFATCFRAGLFLGLFFYPEDGCVPPKRRFTFERVHGCIPPKTELSTINHCMHGHHTRLFHAEYDKCCNRGSRERALSTLAQEAKFLACVREAAGLNPGRNTNYTDSSLSLYICPSKDSAVGIATVTG